MGKFQFHLSGFLEAYSNIKTKIIFKFCHWPSEIIPFIRFEMQMYRTQIFFCEKFQFLQLSYFSIFIICYGRGLKLRLQTIWFLERAKRLLKLTKLLRLKSQIQTISSGKNSHDTLKQSWVTIKTATFEISKNLGPVHMHLKTDKWDYLRSTMTDLKNSFCFLHWIRFQEP